MSTFPEEGIRFLADLALNNNRQWFADHDLVLLRQWNRRAHNALKSPPNPPKVIGCGTAILSGNPPPEAGLKRRLP